VGEKKGAYFKVKTVRPVDCRMKKSAGGPKLDEGKNEGQKIRRKGQDIDEPKNEKRRAKPNRSSVQMKKRDDRGEGGERATKKHTGMRSFKGLQEPGDEGRPVFFEQRIEGFPNKTSSDHREGEKLGRRENQNVE